ncbi:MAG: DUF4232 domain-containing protein [Nocardioidaceae bacterium]|nr:DUF4232 domain-containing protein [Nocardioidaceae bacterium]NUS51478.1 DUF4232 domain-containing protein [Nocardioidaceae bacterium]
MGDHDVLEATPAELDLTLVWRRGDEGSLVGELLATNRADHAVRVSSKPVLVACGLDGADLGVQTIVTAELRIPGYVVLAPGERAEAGVSWGGWDGPPCSGEFLVGLPGGRVRLTASGPRQPESRGPATNLWSSWFERVD